MIKRMDFRKIYPHDLSFYSSPPSHHIEIPALESLSIDRLKVLRIIDSAINRGLHPPSDKFTEFFHFKLNENNLQLYLRLLQSTGTTDNFAARYVDHTSHFMLRYAFSPKDEWSNWFINRERDLFMLRFRNLTPQSVSEFLKINNLHYEPITLDEKELYKDELIESIAGDFTFETTLFYKLDYMEVMDLIKERGVFLKGGFAYVPEFDLVHSVSTRFVRNLKEELRVLRILRPHIDHERADSICNSVIQYYTATEYESECSVGSIKENELDELSEKYYPLCMRNLHESLRHNHHLKHFERVQYMFFIKDIGLPFGECMELWKKEFTQKVEEKKFEKMYGYSVKHAYGKVGWKRIHPAYNCEKIISLDVGPRSIHGCPFKNWDADFLKKKLLGYGDVAISDIEEIVTMAKDGKYQVACGKYFESRYDEDVDQITVHPNEYFQKCYNLDN